MIGWLVEWKIFRNENHAIWFLCSMGFLILLLIGRFYPYFSLIFIITPIIVHVPPLVTATYAVASKRPSKLYSVDCIWFNALMILIYLIVFALIR
ncbi:MAG: hypothetical protein KGJ13_04205 [Patescibacteria group bacterium]|nr:hypothetical protein [Patescibacteria group bacterium]